MTEPTSPDTTTGVEFVDMDEFVVDIMQRFLLTDKQAAVVYHMALGDDLIDAVTKVYKGTAGKTPGGSSRGTSNHYHQTTKLMNMHKFQQALDYIGNQEFIDLRLNRMKLHLLEWGKNKLRDTGWHPSAAVGIWKTLMALAYEERLPNDQKRVADNLSKLTEHFKQMAETQRTMKTLTREELEAKILEDEQAERERLADVKH